MSPWQHRPPNGSAAGGPGPRGNGTGRAAERGSALSVAIPLSMMLTGVLGNALAMLLVSRSYRAKGSRRKRSFLLCIGSLALTDMLGQLLTSPIVISVYLSGRSLAAMDPSGRVCDFFGFSMTVFGLCPLLIASAMAVERALAIRAPHWYASHMSPRATERGLVAIWAAGVAFALLPLAGLGRYALQWPGTWCFISTAGGSAFAAAFASLGLLALVVTGACNLATMGALVARCRAKAGGTAPGSRWGRIATETLLQLLGIMCVLSGCWSPLLVTMLRMAVEPAAGPCGRRELQECDLSLTAVRLASLNQILDPWVYLLLRRILLHRLRQAASAVSHCPSHDCRDRDMGKDRDSARGEGRDMGKDRDSARGQGRDRDSARGRDRDRDSILGEGRVRDSARGQDRDRDSARGEGRDRDMGKDRDSARGQGRDRDSARGRDRDRDSARGEGRDRDSARGRDRDRDMGKDRDRDSAQGRDRDRDSAMGEGRDRDSALGRDRDRDSAMGEGRDRDSALGRDRDRDSARGDSKDRDRAQGESKDRDSALGKDRDSARSQGKDRDSSMAQGKDRGGLAEVIRRNVA